MELPYDPVIPLPGIYPKNMKMLTQKRYMHSVFMAALFTIAKFLKQPKCPSIYEWIRKMWYVRTMEYYLAIKRMKSAIYNNMDGARKYNAK